MLSFLSSSSLRVYRRRRVDEWEKGSYNASSKPTVKRTQPKEEVIDGDLLVYAMDCVGHKCFCGEAHSNKAKETDLVGSPQKLP